MYIHLPPGRDHIADSSSPQEFWYAHSSNLLLVHKLGKMDAWGPKVVVLYHWEGCTIKKNWNIIQQVSYCQLIEAVELLISTFETSSLGCKYYNSMHHQVLYHSKGEIWGHWMKIYMPLLCLKPFGFCSLRDNTFPGYKLTCHCNSETPKWISLHLIIVKENWAKTKCFIETIYLQDFHFRKPRSYSSNYPLSSI